MIIDTREVLVELFNSLGLLNPDEVTLVKRTKKGIEYIQHGNTVMLDSYHILYYLKPKFKYGVLTQKGLSDLRFNLKNLIEDKDLGSFSLTLSPQLNEAVGLKILEKYDYNPSILYELKFISITNKLLARWVLRTSTPESRLLLKLLKS